MAFILCDVIPSDALCLAHIVVSANEHAFRGLVPDQCLEFSEAESSANWQRTLSKGLPSDDFMLVAETPTNECVGYVWAGPNPKDRVFQAELKQINVLPEYQQQGLGRRLISDAGGKVVR
ncbi:MAG: GNAT family N-acetyltransferase, partial [Chloroflexota bacterium]